MPEPTPGEIRIRRRELTILRQALQAAHPLEGCALLLGAAVRTSAAPAPPGQVALQASSGLPELLTPGARGGSVQLDIRLIWPCLNVWEPAAERNHRFLLDPREQLLAQRWGRPRGLQVLGSAHSHPCSAARPSATDLALAVAPTLLLILSPLEDWAPACWWLESDCGEAVRPRPLRWRMVD